jgi:hypothetical protein
MAAGLLTLSQIEYGERQDLHACGCVSSSSAREEEAGFATDCITWGPHWAPRGALAGDDAGF